jgi:hypothetical protein
LDLASRLFEQPDRDATEIIMASSPDMVTRVLEGVDVSARHRDQFGVQRFVRTSAQRP